MINNVVSVKFDKQGYAIRRIHTFRRRQGRLTKRQKYALVNLFPVIGTPYQIYPLNLQKLFDRIAPIILEIGFGMGSSLVEMAAAYPEYNFIGVEVYLPGVGSCLASTKERNIYNLRLICHDAVEVLEDMIPSGSLSLVQIFFPDPWHKARHNKRRIIQPSFIDLIGNKLALGGIVHIATDCKSYAEHILKVISCFSFFRNLSVTGDYVPRPITRFPTKFEQRAHHLGYDVRDLMFEKYL
ncbi:tRNA (guanine-N(7)-)-methyltransferase [secondary endosymbiont of Heteropsylla cubana]|uniref:tRNA (guanine-N(7)-)-methyltransferase n=1 Tax=secondary endosymbiont of Heteropsylla cubana TaxID=134287 RepID=J3TH10_9ENTR|nr:tRNA (guanosine(46)-N7)-methyltransferase TrmB [secondary endosymbiont of Heteropsylla cubana]AFP85827.1 tRNA (guanine-N(7)-)-methyltransferase [secondary endosymbiont of Heteropsylla cubana]